nr:hypothetical protein [Pandoravirus massiliensis]
MRRFFGCLFFSQDEPRGAAVKNVHMTSILYGLSMYPHMPIYPNAGLRVREPTIAASRKHEKKKKYNRKRKREYAAGREIAAIVLGSLWCRLLFFLIWPCRF